MQSVSPLVSNTFPEHEPAVPFFTLAFIVLPFEPIRLPASTTSQEAHQ
jgi:hypothetical protein